MSNLKILKSPTNSPPKLSIPVINSSPIRLEKLPYDILLYISKQFKDYESLLTYYNSTPDIKNNINYHINNITNQVIENYILNADIISYLIVLIRENYDFSEILLKSYQLNEEFTISLLNLLIKKYENTDNSNLFLIIYNYLLAYFNSNYNNIYIILATLYSNNTNLLNYRDGEIKFEDFLKAILLYPNTYIIDYMFKNYSEYVIPKILEPDSFNIITYNINFIYYVYYYYLNNTFDIYQEDIIARYFNNLTSTVDDNTYQNFELLVRFMYKGLDEEIVLIYSNILKYPEFSKDNFLTWLTQTTNNDKMRKIIKTNKMIQTYNFLIQYNVFDNPIEFDDIDFTNTKDYNYDYFQIIKDISINNQQVLNYLHNNKVKIYNNSSKEIVKKSIIVDYLIYYANVYESTILTDNETLNKSLINQLLIKFLMYDNDNNFNILNNIPVEYRFLVLKQLAEFYHEDFYLNYIIKKLIEYDTLNELTEFIKTNIQNYDINFKYYLLYGNQYFTVDNIGNFSIILNKFINILYIIRDSELYYILTESNINILDIFINYIFDKVFKQNNRTILNIIKTNKLLKSYSYIVNDINKKLEL